jgi:hypothetical protein
MWIPIYAESSDVLVTTTLSGSDMVGNLAPHFDALKIYTKNRMVD